MDWSLVLVSQGIETTIDQAEDGTGWGLLVAGQDYGNALRTLRQYRLENRGWPWQQAGFPARPSVRLGQPRLGLAGVPVFLRWAHTPTCNPPA